MRAAPDPTSGFEQAETLDAMVLAGPDDHDKEVEELVAVADFLAPELHREQGIEPAAEVVSAWAGGDADLLTDAELRARREHRDEPAALLHRAAELATAA
jgi:hypothetical protein